MIDRKGLWILLLLIFAMTAAAIWRLSLAPDWTQVTFIGAHGPHTKNGLILFLLPLCLLLASTIAVATKWLVLGPDEAIQVHQRRNRLMLLGTGMMVALMQAFMISRSLGYGLSVSYRDSVICVGGADVWHPIPTKANLLRPSSLAVRSASGLAQYVSRLPAVARTSALFRARTGFAFHASSSSTPDTIAASM